MDAAKEYLGGGSDDRAPPTRAAIGADPFAALVDSAVAVFPNKKPSPDLAARKTQIAAIGPADRTKCDALDKEWKKLDRQ